MAEEKGKRSFTGEELKRIIALVRELEAADASKQKVIRAKLRKIRLYWSEVAPGMAYTVDNLHMLFNDGTLKLSDPEKYGCESTVSNKIVKKEDLTPPRHINISIDQDIAQYKDEGFEGFIPVSMLRGNTFIIPNEAGVYVVIRKSDSDPQFLEEGTGRVRKDRNPNVPIHVLTEKYVFASKTVYIGKATSLRSRIGQLLRFGAGTAGGHWGGRYLWQLADSDSLLVAWKLTPDCDPRTVEAQMIRDFVAYYGKRPFANIRD